MGSLVGQLQTGGEEVGAAGHRSGGRVCLFAEHFEKLVGPGAAVRTSTRRSLASAWPPPVLSTLGGMCVRDTVTGTWALAGPGHLSPQGLPAALILNPWHPLVCSPSMMLSLQECHVCGIARRVAVRTSSSAQPVLQLVAVSRSPPSPGDGRP